MQIIITAFVTLSVTLASGYIIIVWQTQTPHLYYSTTETIPFSGESQVIGIYHISVTNEGGKVARDVVCVVQIPDSNIQQWQMVGPLAIEYSHSLVGNTLKLNFPMINPSESIQLSILANSTDSLPQMPVVSLRGENVVGVEKTSDSAPNIWLLWFQIVSVVLGVGAGSYALYLYLKDKKRQSLKNIMVIQATRD